MLAPLAAATRGGIKRLEDGLPDVRLVREGRVAEGRGWIGLADREAYQLRDIRQVDLAPGWLSCSSPPASSSPPGASRGGDGR